LEGSASAVTKNFLEVGQGLQTTEVREMVAWLVLVAVEIASVQPVTLSSKWLSVTIDPNGSFTVVDKRAKITWRSIQHIVAFRELQKLADSKVAF